MSKLKVMDFFAEWCSSCKSIGPIFDEVTAEIGDVDFQKVDIDTNYELAAKYGIKAIPTIIFELEGKVVHRKMGSITKPQLIELIQEHK
jgi:thioredoxin 1